MKKTDLDALVTIKEPKIHQSCFIADGAKIIGNVTLKKNASIWYNAVLRGDINKIVIGENTNIQDGCILHLENDRACIVGNNVTVGHKAILHGCTIEDNCLIGMGAIILNGAYIKKGSIIGAGAIITENTIVEEHSLMVGIPGKKIKSTPENTQKTNIEWAKKYVKLSSIHKNNQIDTT